MHAFFEHFSAHAPEYYSCPWIEAGLAFGFQSINCCCISHHGNRGWPLLVPNFSGEVFPLEEVIAAKQKLLLANQQPDHDTACRGCSFLQKRRWQPRPYLFDRLNFSHFSKCNLRCVYCWTMQSGVPPAEVNINLLPSLKSLVAENLLAHRAMIFWGGGEPTILPEFEAIFSLLATHGTFQTLNTNGIFLSPAILRWLPVSRFKIVVSVDAGTPETYQKVKGVNAFEKVWANAKAYARVGKQRVFAKYIFLDANYPEVKLFADRVDAANIKMVLADIDERSAAIPPELIEAAGLLSFELRRRGIWFGSMGVGVNAHPEAMWSSRVTAAHRRLARENHHPAAAEWLGLGKQLYHSVLSFIRSGYDPATIQQNILSTLRQLLH